MHYEFHMNTKEDKKNNFLKKIGRALIWFLIGIITSVIAGLGSKMTNLIWPEKPNILLEYSEEWKALGRIYWVATESELLAAKPDIRY